MENKTDDLLISPQPRLGSLGLIIFLSVTNTLIPLSMDMYTPAVPSLPAYFDTTSAVVNMTLSGFYLFFSLGLFFFGPVCDKYGRKPVLIAGIITYTAGGMLCAAAWSIWALIGFRAIQALGAGATLTVSTAIIKDCFAGNRRMQMLALLQILAVVGPIAAPLIGGIIMQISTWRMTFIVLACIGVACCVMAGLYKESLPESERLHMGVFRSLGRLGVVARNRGFMVFLVIVSLFSTPFMAYITCASYVYIDYFGQSAQAYSYFFAASAALTLPGPISSVRILRHITERQLTNILLGMSFAACALLLVFGWRSPFLFCACFLIFAIAKATVRPYSTDLLLSQVDGDTGSASSLINFLVNIFGVFGMLAISAPWQSLITGLALIMLLSMVIALGLWIAQLRMPGLHLKGGDGSV